MVPGLDLGSRQANDLYLSGGKTKRCIELRLADANCSPRRGPSGRAVVEAYEEVTRLRIRDAFVPGSPIMLASLLFIDPDVEKAPAEKSRVLKVLLQLNPRLA